VRREVRKLVAMVAGATILAPAAGLAVDGYDSHVWTPAHDGSGLFVTYGARTLAERDFLFSVSMDYARDPVVLQVGGGAPIASVIDRATTMEIGAFYGLPKNLEAGIAIPASRFFGRP